MLGEHCSTICVLSFVSLSPVSQKIVKVKLLKMLRAILLFVYFQLIGLVKVVQEQILNRQRRLNKSGTEPLKLCAVFFIIIVLGLLRTSAPICSSNFEVRTLFPNSKIYFVLRYNENLTSRPPQRVIA